MDFGPGLPHVTFVQRNDMADLRQAVNEDTAAILVEPLLGEGGVYELDVAFLAEARRLADKYHALLIFDEIQCGLGRTGDWFAFTRMGVQPDALILGKPLGGGIPLSALLVNETLFDAFGVAKHGSTLGGSPMACRLGLEFLQIVEEEGLLEQVKDTGAYLLHLLEELAAVESDGGGGAWPGAAAGAGTDRAGAAAGRGRAGRRRAAERGAGQCAAVPAIVPAAA